MDAPVKMANISIHMVFVNKSSSHQLNAVRELTSIEISDASIVHQDVKLAQMLTLVLYAVKLDSALLMVNVKPFVETDY